MKLKLLIVNLAILFTLTANAQGLGSYNQYGWTNIEPSEDSRIVYVSSSEGDDNNDGLSEGTPKKTIAAGDELIRNGFPDQLLLKRGDVFINETLGRWKSGRSKSEPLVASYYGETGDRPLLIITTEQFVRLAARSRSHVAVVGLEFYKSNSDPNSEDFDNSSCMSGLSISTGGEAENWLVEDCKFRYTSLTIQGNVQGGLGFVHNVYIRRNIITRPWTHGTTEEHERMQGLYVNEIENLYLEENFFDHCGWNNTIEDAKANQFNHNAYIQNSCFGEIVVKGNILMRGSAHGVQLRSGGTARHNVMINNAIGMNIGYSTPPLYNDGSTLVADNVVTDGRPQIPNDTELPQSGAIWGFWKQLIDDAVVNNNIVANILDNRGGNMYPFKDFEDDNANALGEGNIAWNWERNDFPEGGSYTDPDRNIGSFASSKNLDGLDGYSQLHLNRPLKTYTLELSAYEYLNYIREGFGESNDIVSDYTFTDGTGNDGTVLGFNDDSFVQLDIHPNPVSSLINLNPNHKYISFNIFNISGKSMIFGKIQKNQINVATLNDGAYLLRMSNDKGIFEIGRFIKD